MTETILFNRPVDLLLITLWVFISIELTKFVYWISMRGVNKCH